MTEYSKENFNSAITLRITKQTEKDIQKIVRKHQDIFYNESHFVRAAVMKEVREWK